jgi:uncharacterized protein YabE (DUF348 family)
VPGDCEVWSIVLDHLSGRALRVAAQAAVLTAVVGGTVAYTHHGRNVTLVLDGRSVDLQSRSADVRSLLADEGITLSARDLVAPAPDSQLVDGQRVVVRFARPLTATVDGVPRTYWTTELTVDAALKALGIRAEGAAVNVSRSAPLGRNGLDLVVSHPKTVTIAADKRTRHVVSSASTVGELLAEQGVAVRPTDQLSVLTSSPVVDGLVVGVTRIDRRRITVTEDVAPPVTRRAAADLEKGTQRVVAAGRAGTRSVTYTVVLVGGKETSREVVSATVVRAPVAKVVRVGTKPAAPRIGSVAGVDGLNWSALARCESGGNPRAVSPAGYYGLYQFSPSTWRTVGGSGLPSQASADEQLYRAKLLYKRSGAGQWGCGQHLFD